MKLLTQVKARNRLDNAWFRIKFVVLIIVPLFLLVFAAPLFTVVRPYIEIISKPFVDSLVANKETITSVIGILIGAFIPIVGTWAYNSSATKGKNACYKKEVFYKDMLEDVEYLIQFWEDNAGTVRHREKLSFWRKSRDTTASRCLNSLLYDGFESLLCKNEHIVKEKNHLNTMIINIALNGANDANDNTSKQFLCRDIYDMLEKNDKTTILEEIDMLFNRNGIRNKDNINSLCDKIMVDENVKKKQEDIKLLIQDLLEDAKDMKQTLLYLIEYINQHYEAGTKLA